MSRDNDQTPRERKARPAAEGRDPAGKGAPAGASGDPADDAAKRKAAKAARRARRMARRAEAAQQADAPVEPRKTANPYVTFTPATEPSVEMSAALAERLLAGAIDAADSYFRQHVAVTGSVSPEYRAAIAETIAFTRENDPSDTFYEDEFVATAVLLSLLEPELIALAGANADAVAAAYATSKAKVVPVAKDADKLVRAIARDTFIEADFAAHDFGTLPAGALAHIGDRIPTARRLLEAEAKGFDAAIVSGSPGLTDMVRNGLSPVPTLSMVMAADRYRPGDVVAWSTKRRRFEMVVTEEMLDEMHRARGTIDRVIPYPPLSDYLALPPGDRRSGIPALVLFR